VLVLEYHDVSIREKFPDGNIPGHILLGAVMVLLSNCRKKQVTMMLKADVTVSRNKDDQQE